MAPKKDYYKTLGVPETAPAEEIKRAYRRLAKKYHPDVTGGDKAKEAKFKEISEAYETVGDEKRRAQYDAERKSPFGGAGFPGAGAGGPFAGGASRNIHVDLSDLFTRGGPSGGGGGFGDFFSEFFGGGARPSARGADIQSRIEVELPVAVLGGEQSVVVDGKRWNVKIPSGIEEGQVIRIPGKGAAGRGGPGDLLLEVHLRPHPHLRRAGDDLEVDIPIPVDLAVLGGKADVVTLEGRGQVTIPPGTSSGLKLRLRGKGVPRKDGTRGDLYGVIQIVLPREIPPRAKELIVEFAKLTKK